MRTIKPYRLELISFIFCRRVCLLYVTFTHLKCCLRVSRKKTEIFLREVLILRVLDEIFTEEPSLIPRNIPSPEKLLVACLKSKM